MDNDNILKATHFGKVNIAGKELACAVLEDGTRLLTQTAVFQAFDRPRKGKSIADVRNENMPSFVDAKNLKPFADKAFAHGPTFQVNYIGKDKRILTGYNSEILPVICDVYLEARDAGVLAEKQQQLAIVADTLMRSLAKVGITALIDEATGYQYEREQDALQKLLALYVAKDLLPWTKTFPDEFYIQMFRLRDWDYKGKAKTPYAGKLTNYLVYDRLPKEVVDELKKKNPVLSGSCRKARLHQQLTKNFGYVELQKFIHTSTLMMSGFDNWNEFNKVFRKSFNIEEELKDE